MASSNPSVLIFTYSEHGQANLNVATSYELALAGAHVSIAFFLPLKARVSCLEEIITRDAAALAMANQKCRRPIAEFPHPFGMSSALTSYPYACLALAPWPRDEYLASIDHCVGIVTDIKPDFVVADFMFRLAMDACKLAGQKMMVIFPTSHKEVVLDAQPWLAAIWKYAALSSGFSFPLKWWVPLNTHLNIQFFRALANSSVVKGVEEGRKARGLTGGFFEARVPGTKCIYPSLPELDFPYEVIPKEVVSCGPRSGTVATPKTNIEEFGATRRVVGVCPDRENNLRHEESR